LSSAIELALHQAVHQVKQRHRGSRLGKPISGFKSEQSATDHDHALFAGGERQQ
jgi:hypothetical protein